MTKTQWYIGAPNGVVLCIDGQENMRLRGLLWHSYSHEAAPFENAQQMVLEMEKLYDLLNFPHPGTNDRTFGPARTPVRRSHQEREKIMKDEELLQKHGDLGTFIVRVQHRQNSSWQGRITWMEKDKTINFRSVWEMVKLIESAVDTVSVSEDGDEPTWLDDDTQN